MARDKRLSLEQSKNLTRLKLLGAGRDITIELSDDEMLRLFSVIMSDLGRGDFASELPQLPSEFQGDYYSISLEWFQELLEETDLVGIYLQLLDNVPDFATYLGCLCELHKRRRKYSVILRAQPLPKMVQVSPRSLLEFGDLPPKALASWLTWRKWFFDIDNRAGQETGYLFEPILANCLGGIAYPSSRSPIRRTLDARKGRQVDCIVGKDAYEFKLRVTIAASGQGRFAEEIDFARDCQNSGYRPILLVLDPTPNARLTDLATAFKAAGGIAYIGNDAWDHLEAEAGATMAVFIERYVRRPIADIDNVSGELLDLSVSASSDKTSFNFRLEGDKDLHEWSIARAEDKSLETAQADDGREQMPFQAALE
ncbi:ApaLI family restriction endonuclease [uncultured Agrobacterium sp.]|uniref:ApaLI family restriction endonuclease n=1 Tax=uncultured Agrobacterium sp. TaxID=157277 RepID=UPI0025D69DCF|nr:ApaLI family restriction endonuclease [uncultured Agrobacterium sp.]